METKIEDFKKYVLNKTIVEGKNNPLDEENVVIDFSDLEKILNIGKHEES
jgi:hypothetical protein